MLGLKRLKGEGVTPGLILTFDYLETHRNWLETSTMFKGSSRCTCLTAQKRFKHEWALIFCGRSGSVKTGGLTGITVAMSHCTWHCSGVGFLTTWLVI